MFDLKLNSGLNFSHDASRFLKFFHFGFSQDLLNDVRYTISA